MFWAFLYPGTGQGSDKEKGGVNKDHGEHRPALARDVREEIRQKLAKKWRGTPWRKMARNKGLECYVCGKVFQSTTALYVHKMRHNMKC